MVTPAESMEEAIASTRLEGLDLPSEFLDDAALAATGEIDVDELRARTNALMGDNVPLEALLDQAVERRPGT